MEKRVIVAILISIAIIMAFQYLNPRQPAPPSAAGQAPAEKAVVKEVEPVPYVAPEISAQEKETVVETPAHIITFSNIGGAIKDIRLKGFKAPASDEPLEFIRIDNPREYLFNISGSAGTALSDTAIYDVEQIDNGVICKTRTKDFEITKSYVLSNTNNTIELCIVCRNISGSPKEYGYRLISGAGVTEKNNQDKQFTEASSKLNDKILHLKKPGKERVTNPGVVSWTALKTKYFSLIFKPFVSTKDQFYSEDKSGNMIVGITSSAKTIQPGSSGEDKFLIYAGPTQEHILREAGYDLSETINYGFFGGISKILIVTMRFFHNIVRSWGISIILLSIFLNIILFPLTVKSFKSMQKMQEIHPQMEKLKAQHKDNPQKLNKEIMELYKTYKINPFSGCLPMLLQMPVFVALYQALMKSVELRNASFLWIKDLSSPDAVPIPITLPILGNSVNILPLIMVAAMVIQQKVSTKSMGAAITEEQKQQQKIMLIMMPIMFGFIFYNMPSGLVLYWVVNTVLTLAEQSVILKQPA